MQRMGILILPVKSLECSLETNPNASVFSHPLLQAVGGDLCTCERVMKERERGVEVNICVLV